MKRNNTWVIVLVLLMTPIPFFILHNYFYIDVFNPGITRFIDYYIMVFSMPILIIYIVCLLFLGRTYKRRGFLLLMSCFLFMLWITNLICLIYKGAFD